MRRKLFDILPAVKPRAVRRAVPLDGSKFRIDGPDGLVEIPVTVRPQARRMVLRIDRRSGGPILTLPKGVGRVQAERFVADHADWLAQRLKSMPKRVVFAHGAEIPVRGQACRITHRTPFRGETRIVEENGGRFMLVHGAPDQIGTRVERFLRAEAEREIRSSVERHARAAGVTYGRVTIKDTTSRWGSCSASGDLAFSWRLILAPSFVLDYLAAHEIAHRLEMNHSPRFWRHVARLYPDYETAEIWLNRHGASLHDFGRS